jgi:hypothetical protein
MHKNIETHSSAHILSDFMLSSFAVLLIAGTYFGLNSLTPVAQKQDGGASVLGASTTQESVSFLPLDENSPFVAKYENRITTGVEGSAELTLSLKSLENSTYEVSVLRVQNNSDKFQTVQIVPEFSLPESYATISLEQGDLSSVLIDDKGGVFPLDISVQPRSLITITVRIRPTTPISTPTKLRLLFTQRQ